MISPFRVRRARRRILLLLSCTLVWPPLARADDSSAGVLLPGLRSEPPGNVQVTATAVDLRDSHITEALTLRQVGATGAAVVIDGPRFGWLGEGETYPDRQFPELRATVDGVAASAGDGFSAFIEDLDISGLIKQAGLDPFAIAETPPFVDPPDGAGKLAFERLMSLHAVQQSDGQYVARWTARRIFHFDIGKRQNANLSLTFQARPGFALLQFRDIARTIRLESYCVSPLVLAGRLGPDAAVHSFVVRTYAVATGIDGKAPERITLRVGSQHAVFCEQDGIAAFGGADTTPRPARAGGDGIVRVLEVTPPG